MKVLSVKQPWADSIIHGTKRIENRTWKPNIETPFQMAIHASKTYDKSAYEFITGIGETLHREPPPMDDVEVGVILGTVTVTGFVTESDDPWFGGPIGWVLENPVAFENPIPAKGQLRLWDYEIQQSAKAEIGNFDLYECPKCNTLVEELFCVHAEAELCLTCADAWQVPDGHTLVPGEYGDSYLVDLKDIQPHKTNTAGDLIDEDCGATPPRVAGEYFPESDFAMTGEGRKDRDAYYTPAWCTELLFEVDDKKVPTWVRRLNNFNRVLEPCAGTGSISDVISSRVCDCITADIDPDADVDYPGRNFLDGHFLRSTRSFDAVITNPPYTYAAAMVRHALAITPNVAMFLRLTFLEYIQDRRDVVDAIHQVLITERVPFIEGSKKTDSVPHAWFFWSRSETSTLYNGCEIFHATPAEIARAKGQMELGI